MVTSVYPRFAGDATPPFIEHLAKALAESGHEVRVLAPHGKGAAFREKWTPSQGEGHLRICRFPYAFPWGLQKLCYEGGMLVNLKTRPWTKVLLPFFFLAQSFFVAWHWLFFRPHIVHSQSLLPQGLTVALANLLIRGNHVTTSHGNDVFGLRPDGFAGRAKRWVLRRAKIVTVNSRATAQAVRELGCPEGKIRLIPAMPNAVDHHPEVAQKIREEVVRERGPVVNFTGRIIEDKGVGDLLDAMAVLQKEFPDILLLLVGDGQDRERFQKQARELGLAKNCHWAGWVPSAEVGTWMATADVVVVPSRENPGGWKEAQGLVVVEAMTVARPVVATNTGGIPDMVEDGETGKLVSPSLPEALAEALGSLLRSPDTAREMGKKGQLKAKRIFSQEAVRDATVKMYQELGGK
ncbi:MAG: glycosyltransferase [Opitutales bacterium]|nr:glycosyltransferase [Opitutales bacterium]